MTEPFFDRTTTHELIRDLSAPQSWVIYAGLGVTIDRTGISWSRLIDRLLARFVPEDRVRDLILTQHGEIRSATIVDNFYERDHGNERLQFLQNDIARILYGPRKYMEGKLLEAIALLVFQLVAERKSVALVTPNYDDYLFTDLVTVEKLRPRHLFDGAIGIDLRVATGNRSVRLPSDWTANPAIVPVIHLHGYVPRPGDRPRGVPVVSEADYSATNSRSTSTLIHLFRERNVMILGSSVTDAPLVSALLATKPASAPGADKSYRRLAVMPVQGLQSAAKSASDLDELKHWDAKRLSELGVSAVQPDFFIQAAQLLIEVQRAMRNGTGPSMTDYVSPQRYGVRLVAWWEKWQAANCSDPVSTQTLHHGLLVQTLSSIRRDLGASPAESLKLEVWMRWKPSSGRTLRLWASSVGTWPDINSMRADTIEPRSKYKSVQAFCQGAPVFMHDDSESRWKSYLALPVWLPDVSLPVAVVTLGSMYDRSRSSVSEKNLRALEWSMAQMREVTYKIIQ